MTKSILKERLEADAARFAALAVLQRSTSALTVAVREDEDNIAFASRIIFDEEKMPKAILDAEYAAMGYMRARLTFNQQQLKLMQEIENSILDSFGKP